MNKFQKIFGLILLFFVMFTLIGCEMSGGTSTVEPTNPTDEDKEGIYFITNGGDEVSSILNIEKDTVVTLPTPLKEGCTFIGWYLSSELTGNKLAKNYKYPGGIVKLYADWMPNNYMVYLESDEVELSTNSVSLFFGEEINISSPTSDYYSFIGWELDGEIIDSTYLMPAHDITLKAVWGAKEFTITLDLAGGVVDNFISSYNLKSGESIDLPTPVKEHAIFAGWYDSLGMQYTSTSKFYQEMTLTAHYNDLSQYEATYKITYVTDGGIVPSGYEEYEVGVQFTLPIPAKAGFEFLGWYLNDIYYGDALTYLSSTTVLDQVLYAKWNEIKDQYTVTFNNNGSKTNVEVPRGEMVKALSLSSTLGWYLGNQLFDFTTPINQDLMLYANFKDLEAQYMRALPSVATNDLTFTKQLTVNGNNYTFTYVSSDPNTISAAGVLNPDHFNKIVTITLTSKCGTTINTQAFDIIVPKIIFSDLKAYKPVFAYVYAGSHKQFSETFMNTVDVVNLAFGRVTEESTLSLNDVQSKLSTILQVRKAGIRVVLSIGGGGGASLEQFSNTAYTAETRLKFANSLLDAVKQYHFDGIDIDWEYPGYNTGRDTSVDRPNFTLLIATIYQVLKEYNPELIITAALPGGRWGYERYALDKVEKYLDYIHLMTYDFHDSNYAYHHTALYPSNNSSLKSNVKDSVDIYVNEGVPIEKLVIGVAFYGRVYVLSGAATAQYGIGSSGVIKSGDHMTYTEIYNYLKDNRGSYITYYDPVACAPSIYIPSENKVITYDNANSISAKCNYVNSTNVGGIMYWENGEDQTDALLNALYKGMK